MGENVTTKEGTVDSVRLRMSDVIGDSPIGGPKYISVCNGTTCWYRYTATANDYKLLAEAVTTFVKIYK